MIDPRKQQELDQGIQAMAETFASLWWSLFEKLCQKGFSSTVALDLLKTYIDTNYANMPTITQEKPPEDE